MSAARWIGRGVLVGISLVSSGAWATEFYVDPQNGSSAGDGSQQAPWRTLEEVVAANLFSSQTWDSLPYAPGKQLTAKNANGPIKAGDTVWLKSGYHGELNLVGYYNADSVTIAAAPGDVPQFSRVVVQAGKNWVLSGLHVSPEYAPNYDPRTMIDIDSHDYQGPVTDVVVENCVLTSRADVSSWSASDWDQLSANGIQTDGDKITIRNNQLKNVNFGISVGATNSLVERNLVDSFAGDGLRGLGDNTVFQYNVVKNCYDVNDNHDDGFQSWSVGSGGVGTGEVKGIVLRGNVIINYEDPNQPFRGPLQGIGCFDGTFVDWVVENNVIITDHWHGITLLGARNVRVVNNTVLDPNSASPGPPWISIDDHKNGTAPENCLVRNNLTTDLALAATGVSEDHNVLINGNADQLFLDVASYDVHLKDTSPAIDQGSADMAPAIDIEGVPRPQGAGVDVGAYEWHDGSVIVDGGVGGSSGNGGSGGSGAQGSGGSSGSGNGAAGGGSNASPGADEDSGCGCRVGAPPSPELLLAALGLLSLAFMRRRVHDAP